MPAATGLAPNGTTGQTSSATGPKAAPITKTPSPSRGALKNLFSPDPLKAVGVSKMPEARSSTSNLARNAPADSLCPPPIRTKISLAAGEGPWSVSVAEAGEERKPRKKGKPKAATPMQSYTLYITTPTHNLTLQRSVEDIMELDMKLRQAGNVSLPKLPKLLLSSNVPSIPASPSPSHGGSRRLLQTISRTLSPGSPRHRTTLKQITKSLASGPPTTSTAPSTATAATGTDGTAPPVPVPESSSAQSPAPEDTVVANGKITSGLVNYFTTLSNLPTIKTAKPWKEFTRVRTDDLESQRVERRVHRVRSDLASHSKSAVAPTNVNVGGEGGRRADESQSDIGEDWAGRGTEDERENGSTSGRSGSRQSWNAGHAMALTRTASGRSSAGEEEVGTSGAAAAKKASPHFANIPEESEKEKEAVASSQQQHLTTETSQTNTSGDSSWADGSAEGNKAEGAPAKKSPNRRRKSDRSRSDKVTVDDFEMIRVLGKGCAGKVLLVRHKPTTGLFAMKSIHKRHVLAHQELQHTLTEQAVLKRMAREALDPFCVKLWWSFHDKQNLYLVMDFHPGGDLATQLSRWGRLGRDRARFYAAEIVEGVEGLHKAGVIYRDLKPENVLIAADGHIVLSDFGLSKEFPDRRADRMRERGCTTPPPLSPPRSNSSRDLTTATAMTATTSGTESPKTRRPPWVSASEEGTSTAPSTKREERDMTTTFCGTAEYLAPEVIQGAAYSYEVDWWSFGTMLYEFLVGVTPFWADTHADMYIRVLHDELVFPEDRVLDSDTKGFLRGLLQRNPMLRMKEPRIKKHPYFSMIEWDHVYHKRYIPPYVPPINPLDETDTQNFDEAFLDMQPVVQDEEDDAETVDPEEKQNGDDDDGDAGTRVGHGDEESAQPPEGDATATMTTSPLKPSEALAKSLTAADGKSLFDGYSFRGRKDSGSMRSSFRSESIDSDLASELVASENALENTLRSARGAASDPPPPERSPTPTPAEAYAHSQLEAERKTPVAPGPASSADLPRSSTTVRPSDDALYHRVSVEIPASAILATSLPTISSPPTSPMLSAAPPLFQPVPQRPRKEEIVVADDELEPSGEDDDTATREAVFALAALERQASQDQSLLNAEGMTTTSTLATLAAAHDQGDQGGQSTSQSRGGRSATALPTTREKTVGDADDEDDGEEEEEWDLVDTAIPSSTSGRGLPSDVNGGKGQNLFARGVVDTYRMLRRQDSMRPTGGAAQGSGAIPPRPFSRLAGRRKGANASAEMTRPSKADLKSGSVVSLDSSGNVAANGRSSAAKDAPSRLVADGSPEGGRRPSEGVARASSGAPGGESTSDSARPSGEAAVESGKTRATSTSSDLNASSFAAVSSPPSAAAAASAANASVAASASNGGPVHANGNADLQKRQSRIRRRFTTFFEQAAR
ncbi:hypothetical protein BCV69DRAFT_276084 [Microstroma glucosiphilum]|uniref:non-specific serine/threonine protein kinase n=1 Tax=Pseudomicrostroma glucosiphilum TaxID=1684307 RepID=A0A316UDZ1_9BASI|nr:hypothetical protein BCV69DRAFT_276084 [Pseudomicrostroma glucosiphilum]PWN23392.1 hypothetical protein BCV69DRAFT_276084 [Pseudomicrostroma glucosiphilum]